MTGDNDRRREATSRQLTECCRRPVVNKSHVVVERERKIQTPRRDVGGGDNHASSDLRRPYTKPVGLKGVNAQRQVFAVEFERSQWEIGEAKTLECCPHLGWMEPLISDLLSLVHLLAGACQIEYDPWTNWNRIQPGQDDPRRRPSSRLRGFHRAAARLLPERPVE